jgi:hypothetical protein
VVCKLVASVGCNEAFGVDEPEAFCGFFFGKAFVDEVLNYLLGYSYAGGAGAEEYCACEGGWLVLLFEGRLGIEFRTMVFWLNPALFDGADDSTHNHRSSALDIIVEHGVVVAVSFQRVEGILPVLELDHNIRPALLQCEHQLVQESHLLFMGDLISAAPKIQWILPELLVTCAKINCQRKRSLWSDSSTSSVEYKFSNGDTHSINAEIT